MKEVDSGETTLVSSPYVSTPYVSRRTDDRPPIVKVVFLEDGAVAFTGDYICSTGRNHKPLLDRDGDYPQELFDALKGMPQAPDDEDDADL